MRLTLLRFNIAYSYIPCHSPIRHTDVIKLKEFLQYQRKILILTGAGISTESGIPDYRSKDVGLYARSAQRPITYQQFVKSVTTRQRYWIRNYVGWPRFSSFQPNKAHYAVRSMEQRLPVSKIVTQNVDRLHHKAGSKDVTELHGTTFRVVCINCDYNIDRNLFQHVLKTANPSVNITSDIIRPDGDVGISQDQAYSFIIPECPNCRSILKPDLVFFGDNVPTERVVSIQEEISNCGSILVLGSSLTVFSAYRIILQAVELRKPVAVVNIGETRADDLVQLKIEARCGEILPLVLREFDI